MTINISNINRTVRQLGFADESQYFISIEGYGDSDFIVESVEVSDWTLGQIDDRIRVKVLAMTQLDPQSLLNRKAIVSLFWRGTLAPVVTQVASLMEGQGNGEAEGYWLTLVSPLQTLQRQRTHRVFLEQSSLSIAQDILNEYADGRFAIEVKATDPAPKPMTVQYQESDWAFLYRILLQDGIMLTVDHGNENITVQMIDDLSQLPLVGEPIDLSFRSARGAAADEEYVSMVRRQWQATPGQIQVADYQADQALPVYGEAMTSQASNLTDYRWGVNAASDDQASQFAEQLKIAHEAKASSLLLQSNCRGLRPGMTIRLHGHPQWNGEYVIVQAELEGQQFAASNASGSGQSRSFQTSVIAVPAGRPYLPVLPPPHRIASTLTATITAEVDASGCYQIRLPFDRLSEAGHTSLPTRLMQHFGGEDHGMHFPLTVGTEVVVGFENGDVDRPVILGAATNQQTPSVVTEQNAYENLIRTRSGHEFLMDDTPSSEKIRLNTLEQKNRLELDATKDNHQVSLVTDEGDMTVSAGKNISISSGENLSIDVGTDHQVTVKGQLQLMTEEGDIRHESGSHIQMTAAEDIQWVTEEGDMTLEAGGQWIVEAAEGMSTHVQSGDQLVVVEDGSYALEAASDISLSAGGSITLTQGSSTLQIDASGNLTLDASQIEMTADSIIVKGGTVGNN